MDISVVLSTYNRSTLLQTALHSLQQQQAGNIDFEVIVVDNNSTDDTRQVVAGVVACDHRFRYIFEAKQGLSHGLNAGIAGATGAIIALTDDDLVMPPDWLVNVKRAFDQHPEVAFVGSRVLPVWCEPVPVWLSRDIWSALALQDCETRFVTGESNPVCLIGKAFRREALIAGGNFRPDLGRVKGGLGSLEDDELQRRLWKMGMCGMHVPSIVLHAPVDALRMKRNYFRRWYSGHGKHYAILRAPDMEASRGRLFDVPVSLYRQAAFHCVTWIVRKLKGDTAGAFANEMRIWFFLGFLRQRASDARSSDYSLSSEMRAIGKALFSKC